MGSTKSLKEIQEELTWISLENKSRGDKGIFNVLVPLGCIVTTGILSMGVYNLYKKRSRNQQLLMRYRVLAQGVTAMIAATSILLFKPSA